MWVLYQYTSGCVDHCIDQSCALKTQNHSCFGGLRFWPIPTHPIPHPHPQDDVDSSSGDFTDWLSERQTIQKMVVYFLLHEDIWDLTTIQWNIVNPLNNGWLMVLHLATLKTYPDMLIFSRPSQQFSPIINGLVRKSKPETSCYPQIWGFPADVPFNQSVLGNRWK